ncbi:hypothetical protein VCV18_004120 [Metarhizium anisopliae]
MDARCQCGAVGFKTPLPEPLALYICHCAECKRQTSSAFGASAIFPRFRIPEAELLSCYASNLLFQDAFVLQTKNVVSVKGGCLEGLDWGKAIHLWTKSAMVPIPEGSETHSEGSSSTDYGSTQEFLDQPLDQPGSELTS